MAFLPPDAPAGPSAVPSLRMSSMRNDPSDYQIRLDALTLTVQMAMAIDLETGEHFAEWQDCFENSLRSALES